VEDVHDSASEPPDALADPGTLLATTHAVGGGLRVRLRLTRPADGLLVRAFLERLSPDARHRRFFSAMPVVSETLLHRFTFYDPRRRLVVAATTFVDGAERIVGLADVTHLQTGLAELALVVDEKCQGHGIGRLLTEAIASLARQQGATHLKAELLERNAAMLTLMQRLGLTRQTFEDGVTILMTRLPDRTRRAA
jgi:GNAT superfamily N-acetyltransferase